MQRYYIPVRRSGNLGQIGASMPDLVELNKWEQYDKFTRVLVVLADNYDSVSVIMYYNRAVLQKTLRGTKKKVVTYVCPPLLDIRSNSKTFPAARRVAYCALRGLSFDANPFTVAEESQQYADEEDADEEEE